MAQGMKVRDIDSGATQEVDFANGTVKMTDASGRLVTMDISVNDVHIDAALANYAAGFRLQGGVADVAAPVIPVDKQTDKFWTWDKNDAFQQVESLVSTPGAPPREISPRLSNSSYVCLPYALGAFIPTELQANADSPLQMQMAHLNRLLNVFMLGREVRVSTALRATGNYGSNFKSSLGSTAKWNGGSASDPIADLHARIEASVMPITDIIMSEQVWHDFARNAAVQKFVGFKQQVPGIPYAPSDGSGNGNVNSFSAILGLPPIHIAAMKYLDSSGNYSYVWGGDVVLVHRPQTSLPKDGRDIATAYTFRWNGGDAGGATADGGFLVRSFFNPHRGARGGTQLVVTHNDAEQFIQDSVSGLIVGAHQ